MWRSPNGAYSGFSVGYDEQEPKRYTTMLNGRMVEMETMPGGYGSRIVSQPPAEAPQGPDVSEVISQRYRDRAAASIADQIRGNVPVGISGRAMLNDRDFTNLWNTDQEAARRAYANAYHGMTPEQDDYAEQRGYGTLAALRAAQGNTDQERQFLSDAEANWGFNPGLAMNDYTPESKSGWDRARGMVISPPARVRNETQLDHTAPDYYVEKPGMEFSVPDPIVMMLREVAARRSGFPDNAAVRKGDARLAAIDQQEAQELAAWRKREAAEKAAQQRAADPVFNLTQPIQIPRHPTAPFSGVRRAARGVEKWAGNQINRAGDWLDDVLGLR